MSSTSTKRAPTTATQRLKQDYLRIKKDPVPYICAEPLPSNILECKPCCQVVAAGLDGSVRPVPQEPLARPARCLSLPERRVLFPKRPVGALRTTWIPCYLSHRKAAGLCLRKRTTSSCVPSFHGLGTVTKQDHIPGHYVVRGPEMTPYEGGYYHGKLIFPREFPFKPPSIYMITPNGRFKCNTRLCLSITDFHPDTWNPAWSVSTILTGLLSFMVEKGPTLGSIETSDFTKRQLAAQSSAFNLKDKVFCELFPEVVEEIKQKQKAQDELSSRPQTLPLPDVVPDGETHLVQNGIQLLNGHAPGAIPNLPGLQQANRHHGLLGGALANLFVIVGFAAFAYTVKYVLRSIAQE
ncbi:ubiquitin-conjugating enzyme E2 J2 isoform X2 [Callithrix jacchus]|nr:ubiquitin-conjugating enzyme E2 J2 isoform X2 [Callithrix jacchus]XP_035163164.1 ubiquitin-conjugating enzyme E2 J2 isoform X2 [Callithrix jacchus]XP_054092803.1 ubiquitin-conjugating enzyme E2 J2 isoform X2 [Callithrix jacchus]